MRNLKALAFDLDGTIYFGNEAAFGALETIEYFQKKGLRVVYFTNNSAITREQIYLKLLGMGFTLNISDVYTSGYLCAWYVKNLRLVKVFCFGSPGLQQELENEGITLTTDDDAEAIVIGLDTQFDYNRLAQAMNIWKAGVMAIACNVDRSYPVENGYLLPGCGAIVGALESAVGRKVDVIIGKPNTMIIELAAKNLGIDNKSIIVIGDNIESDIEMAKRFGCPAILVNNIQDENITSIKALMELKDLIRI